MPSPAASQPDVGVIIVAAGAGVRAGPGEPKQFRPIHGVPLLLRALRPFTSHPDVGRVAVALPAGLADRPPDWLAKLAGARLVFVTGGGAPAHFRRAGPGARPPRAPVVVGDDPPRPLLGAGTDGAGGARAPRGGRAR